MEAATGDISPLGSTTLWLRIRTLGMESFMDSTPVWVINLGTSDRFTGTFGDGILQIVIDQDTGRFHVDVDRFNPYEDVVNFFGHTFAEVLPNLFRRIC